MRSSAALVWPHRQAAVATQLRGDTKLLSDLSARDNPRVRLAGDQCIPAWALLASSQAKQ